MTRQDPGAATGTGRYPVYLDCTCGAMWTEHEPGKAGVRKGCTRTACPAYSPAQPVPPRLCPTCGQLVSPAGVV